MVKVLVAAGILVIADFLGRAPNVSAQKPKPRAAAPAVKRAQDADVIEAAGGNLAIALYVQWDGGSQEMADLKGCVATIKSTRTLLGVMTIDEQTFDAGDLTGDIEPVNGGAYFEIRMYSQPKLRTFVTRRRTAYLDGAPKVLPAEKAIYLSLYVPNSETADVTKTVLAAVGSYRAFCRRV
jgi:hypothetical protein